MMIAAAKTPGAASGKITVERLERARPVDPSLL